MTGNYEHHIDQDAKVQDAKKAINHLSKDASRRVIFENSVFYEDPLTLRPKKDFQPPPWAEVAAKAKVQDNDSRTRIASDAIKSMHKRPEALVSGAHLDRVLKWAQGDKRIEKPDGSVWYRAPVDWLDNADRFHVFVVEHEWSKAFENATDFDGGEWRPPFDECAFEFQVSGFRLILLLVGPNPIGMMIRLA